MAKVLDPNYVRPGEKTHVIRNRPPELRMVDGHRNNIHARGSVLGSIARVDNSTTYARLIEPEYCPGKSTRLPPPRKSQVEVVKEQEFCNEEKRLMYPCVGPERRWVVRKERVPEKEKECEFPLGHGCYGPGEAVDVHRFKTPHCPQPTPAQGTPMTRVGNARVCEGVYITKNHSPLSPVPRAEEGVPKKREQNPEQIDQMRANVPHKNGPPPVRLTFCRVVRDSCNHIATEIK